MANMSKKFDPIKFRYDIKKYAAELIKSCVNAFEGSIVIDIDRDANRNKFIRITTNEDFPRRGYFEITAKLKTDKIVFACTGINLIMIPYNQKLKYLIFNPPEYNLNPLVCAVY